MNEKLSVDVTRKLGMIKASGYEVIIEHDEVAWCFIDVTIGNDLESFDDIFDLEEYVDKKYKEIVQNESN